MGGVDRIGFNVCDIVGRCGVPFYLYGTKTEVSYELVEFGDLYVTYDLEVFVHMCVGVRYCVRRDIKCHCWIKRVIEWSLCHHGCGRQNFQICGC